jgi:putative FmdB family regulatory protein
MPIYEYVCRDCGTKYDKFVRSASSEVKLKCPKCGSVEGDKAFSAFSARTNGGGVSSGPAVSSAPACGPIG